MGATIANEKIVHMKVILVGNGKIGTAVTKTLQDKGIEVHIYTDRIGKISEKTCQSNILNRPELSEAIIVTSLPDSEPVLEHVQKNSIKQKYIIDLATNENNIVQKLHEECKRKNIRYIELPQLTGPTAIAEGKGVGICTEKNLKAKDSSVSIVRTISPDIIAVSKDLQPTQLKLIHNYAAASHLGLYREIFSATRIIGIEPRVMAEMLEKSPMYSVLMSLKLTPKLTENTESPKPKPAFTIRHMLKDLRYFRDILKTKGKSIIDKFDKSVINDVENTMLLFKETGEKYGEDQDTSSVINHE